MHSAIYAKQFWPVLAEALATRRPATARLIRILVDAFYGRNDDGTYDPGSDRYFTIGADRAAVLAATSALPRG